MSKYIYRYTVSSSGQLTREKVRKPTLLSKLTKKIKLKIHLPNISISKKGEKYYCFDRKRWCEEHKLLGMTIYKLTLNTKRTKWSIRSSKNKMTKPRITHLTTETRR